MDTSNDDIRRQRSIVDRIDTLEHAARRRKAAFLGSGAVAVALLLVFVKAPENEAVSVVEKVQLATVVPSQSAQLPSQISSEPMAVNTASPRSVMRHDAERTELMQETVCMEESTPSQIVDDVLVAELATVENAPSVAVSEEFAEEPILAEASLPEPTAETSSAVESNRLICQVVEPRRSVVVSRWQRTRDPNMNGINFQIKII